MKRTSQVERITAETKVSVKIELDGEGTNSISTGIGFFDHMLNLLGAHSRMNLEISAQGDLHVDTHHTVEDVGIVFGKALSEALGDRKSINRYGQFFVPMDESLAFACIDISGRPYLHFDADFSTEKVGQFETQMVEEFFRALAVNAGLTLHIKLEYGSNDHHKIEAIFKAVAHALREAVQTDQTIKGVLSTKGII